jgi:hypothetical protein
MLKFFSFRYLPFLLIFFSFFSCDKYKPVQFPVTGTGAVLLAFGRTAQEGKLNFSTHEKLEFNFDETFTVPPVSSLVVEYNFSIHPSHAITENYSLVLNMDEISWELPMDIDGLQYVIPVNETFQGYFNITLEAVDKNFKMKNKETPVLQIHSLGFTDRWFGFNTHIDEYNFSSPFLYRQDSNSGNKGYVIDVPPAFLPDNQLAEIKAVFSSGGAVLEYLGVKTGTYQDTREIYIPPALYPAKGKAVLSGEGIGVFSLTLHQSPINFPKPIIADPALIITWPKEKWRNPGYEVFKWDQFPSLLILDTADYAVQDRLLKRIAFFVEKTGFRGRLPPDSEIAGLYGWYAHDYRAEDLAQFFNRARNENFPLLAEERELEKILLSENIIREEQGGIKAGFGGLLSISRESPDYLRYRFMAHEGFHGLFFIDEDFRSFCRYRWEQLSAPSKKFIEAFFDFMQYDIKDEYLLINEFMAYILQQPSSQAGGYFSRNMPARIEGTLYAYALPPKDRASGSWPSLYPVFAAEAEAFSAYVTQRWGLTAGRVWNLKL